MNTLQGNNAMVAFFKDTWVPVLCVSDFSIEFEANPLDTRTISDGHWDKITYGILGWSAQLSGLLIMNNPDDTNWSGFDTLQNLMGMNCPLIRMSWYTDAGDVKTVQGEVLISGLSFSGSAGTLIKNDCSFKGNGEPKFFDGLIPCDTSIDTITVDGQTAADGIVHISYTYTGNVYQVKYRIDGQGNYAYALPGVTIDIPDLSIGSHEVEIIPVCQNGYEGLGDTQGFIVTQALTCAAVITSVTGSATSINLISFTGTPTQWKYRIDGGSWVYVPISITSVSSMLPVGTHTVEAVPICANGVEGTGDSDTFVVSTQPAQSTINYQLNSWTPGNTLFIYVNGILRVNQSTTGSGTITVANGDTVRGELVANQQTGNAVTFRTRDVTISSILNLQSGVVAADLQYIFTANGDTYEIFGQVTP